MGHGVAIPPCAHESVRRSRRRLRANEGADSLRRAGRQAGVGLCGAHRPESSKRKTFTTARDRSGNAGRQELSQYPQDSKLANPRSATCSNPGRMARPHRRWANLRQPEARERTTTAARNRLTMGRESPPERRSGLSRSASARDRAGCDPLRQMHGSLLMQSLRPAMKYEHRLYGQKRTFLAVTRLADAPRSCHSLPTCRADSCSYRETQVAYAVPSSFPYSWLNSGNASLTARMCGTTRHGGLSNSTMACATRATNGGRQGEGRR